MAWNVTQTVLSSVFGGLIIACFLYGVAYRLRPHIRRPKDRPDFTLPQVEQKPPDVHLRASLYARPSTNFIDPRNSVADTDLMSSRWSTSVLDLDLLTSPASPSTVSFPRLPRSPCVDFKSPCPQNTQSPSSKCTSQIATPVPAQQRRWLRPALSTEALGHRRQSSSNQHTYPGKAVHDRITTTRLRSKSDTALYAQRTLLSLSHALFSTGDVDSAFASPNKSDFSGITILETPRSTDASVEGILDTGTFESLH